MKDYSKSFFWRCLRRVGVYPFHVIKWRSKAIALFHTITFWKFFNHDKALREISEHSRRFSPLLLDEDLQQIEQSF